MRHEMLTQSTFLPSCTIKKGYAESAFCDACLWVYVTSKGCVAIAVCTFLVLLCRR